MNVDNLKKDLQKLADPEKGKFLQRFFKTGVGEYAEGDIFFGITVPQTRMIAKKYKDLSLEDIKKLLQSKIHEERLIALLILVDLFKRGNRIQQKKIYDFYLSHTQFINNWDLVDTSADKIVGAYLLTLYPQKAKELISFDGEKDKTTVNAQTKIILSELATSNNIWQRRIAMIATFQFIKSGYYKEALFVAELLLNDKHDLIHKAVGWMLREVGKRCSPEILENFLKKHYQIMPRTMLRYAIEHFSDGKKRVYMKKN